MQNIENNGKTLKDLQKFPDVFTFKIMGKVSGIYAKLCFCRFVRGIL